MNHIKNAGRAYILFSLSLCLPWFTFNAKVMGYCHGYDFIKYLFLPMAVLAFCLVCKGSRGLRIFFGEVSLAGILGITVCAIGGWQSARNIREGIHWMEGLRTAVPTYWVSLILALVLVAMGQPALLLEGKAVS